MTTTNLTTGESKDRTQDQGQGLSEEALAEITEADQGLHPEDPPEEAPDISQTTEEDQGHLSPPEIKMVRSSINRAPI